MLNIITTPELKFNYVIDSLLPKPLKQKIFKTHQQVHLIESIFYAQSKIDHANHYDFIDDNSVSYCPKYETTVTSQHSNNILFISLLLAKINMEIEKTPALKTVSLFKNADNPINGFSDLENTISRQFYRNKLFAIEDSALKPHLETLISQITLSIDFLQNEKFDEIYKNLIAEENKENLFPSTLSRFVQHLEDTLRYLEYVLTKV